MSEDHGVRKPRKGTKSCTECRRRKVRCIRASESSPICRRCEERGTKCTEQVTSTPNPVHAKMLSSRQRISQLEHQVGQLIELAHGNDVTLSQQPLETTGHSTDKEDSNSDISDVDEPDDEQPAHLRSLFQNDWLSVDPGQAPQDRKAKATAQILYQAKSALVVLIPTKNDFIDMCTHSSQWLGLLHTMLPQPFMAHSENELLKTYDEMIRPNVSAITLASWLLIVAITARQDPEEPSDSGTPHEKIAGRLRLSRRVSEVVENKLIRHNRLLSTPEGLAMGLHFVRLQLGFGSFRKAWIHLRSLIAIAELMGLPNACRHVEIRSKQGLDVDAQLQQKSELWESISGADRILYLTVCLPSGTRRYEPSGLEDLVVDGVVNPRTYLSKMASIATKLQDMDDMIAIEKPQGEVYSAALSLDRDLRNLAGQTPTTWWALVDDEVKGHHMVQFLHNCTMMRIHLPFTMRQRANEEYFYSRSSCIAACKAITSQYRFLRPQLPSGFFVSRTLDLQAFAATVVLLLTFFSSSPKTSSSPGESIADIERLVEGTLELMDRKSSGPSASNYGPQSASAIRALYALLQRDETASGTQKAMTLKVPLLGTLHISRNAGTAPITGPGNDESWERMPNQLPQSSFEVVNPQQVLPADNFPVFPVSQQQAGWWDPFSWSVDTFGGNFFQDPIMAESFDPMYGVQSSYNALDAF